MKLICNQTKKILKFSFLFISPICFQTILASIATNLSPESLITTQTANMNPYPKIKVLLGEFNTNQTQYFNIQSKKEFVIKARDNKKTKNFILCSSKFQILLKNNTMYGRSKKGPLKKINYNEITIKPAPTQNDTITPDDCLKTIMINKKPYHGTLTLKLCNKVNKLSLINTLDLEDYVYAVLLAESYQTWPLNMQKIQAIISRTYAVHQMLNQKKIIYDIKCNNFHQRYTGNHNYHHLRQAVDETHGLILTHNGDVVLTMFDACCGGSIPAHINGIDFTKAPYLARQTPCHFCKNYKLYKWKRTIPTPKFLACLKAYAPLTSKLRDVQVLHDLKVNNKDKAGVVHTVKLTVRDRDSDSLRSTIISGNDVWLSMNDRLRSQNFSIQQTCNSIIIDGRGFGHQLGLCQRGARELVRQGWPLKKILTFYYPNTKLARLKIINPTCEKEFKDETALGDSQCQPIKDTLSVAPQHLL